MTRRELLRMAGLGALAFSVSGAGRYAFGQIETEGDMKMPSPYELPPLPYAYDALEPVISKQILELHHDKHHAGYVKGLNAALEKLEGARKAGDMAAIRAISRDLAFNGSGHALHTLYWMSMTPKAAGGPSGALKSAIERDFGSVDAFKKQFTQATKDVEASGWGILGWEPLGKRLLIMQAERHEDLTMWGIMPIMCCDVWEHAYYLQYKNDRGAYVDKVWDIIDWEGTAKRLAQAGG